MAIVMHDLEQELASERKNRESERKAHSRFVKRSIEIYTELKHQFDTLREEQDDLRNEFCTIYNTVSEKLPMKETKDVTQLPSLREMVNQLIAERDAMPEAIRNYCHNTKWAVPKYKEQPHIKALFDIAGEDVK